jgi:hypothetical protein
MFAVGNEYTRDQIHAAVGGDKVSYLPTRNGSVLAACLTRRLNPRVPEVILCGRGPRIARSGDILASQVGAIPVFTKNATNRWQYHGEYVVASSHVAGADFEKLIANSGRPASDVSRVIVMKRVR